MALAADLIPERSKTKSWSWLWVLLVALVLLIGVIRHFLQSAAESELREQLRGANAEGLFTTSDQFAASIPKAIPAENAAPLYRSLAGMNRTTSRLIESTDELTFHPTPKGIAAATAGLETNKALVATIDKAAALPRCWFDRDWSTGFAVLLPEYATMRSASKLVALRGTLAAHRGDARAAIGNVREMFAIANHAGEENIAIAAFLRESIYLNAMHKLAWWAFLHPEQPAYREELRNALDHMPQPHLRVEHRGDLFELLSLMDLTVTSGGRRVLGLKENDVSSVESVAPMFLSRTAAKAEVVRAYRLYWEALLLPQSKRGAVVDAVDHRIARALFAYPTALSLYQDFLSASYPNERENSYVAKRQQYIAYLRAMDQSKIPRSIKTSDLKSPYNGSELAYAYDGKQIRIKVSDDFTNGLELAIPPQTVFSK